MRRFWSGLFWGLLLGGVLGWLWRRWCCSLEHGDSVEGPIISLAQEPSPPLREQKSGPVQLGSAKQAPPDDLTVLRGVGPAFAQRLQQAGIHRYAQIASTTPEALSEHCGAPAWRIRRDDWIGQAADRVQ